MLKVKIKSWNKEEGKEDRKLAAIIRTAMRNGADCKEEVLGFVVDKYFKDKKKKEIEKKIKDKKIIGTNSHSDGRMRMLNYSDSVRRVVPEIIDELDKKFQDGKELTITVLAEDFLLELEKGGKRFRDENTMGIIRRVFHYEGLEITEFHGVIKNGDNDGCKKKREKFYEIRALTDEDVEKIKEKNRNYHKRDSCRKMAKEVCRNKVYNEDENSIWKDTEFIKNIGGCSFDVDFIEEKVKMKRNKLLPERIENGFGLLFELEEI